ncbi:MAG: transglutaminase-like domain-containing protein [Bacteroidota bacterium]
MKKKELKAIVSLLEDKSIRDEIEQKILELGTETIPFLEEEWEKSFNPDLQGYLEDIIHKLQFILVKERLVEWKQSESDNLLKGMWIIAAYQYPDLTMEQLQQDLEQLYYEVWLEHKPEDHIYDQIKFINSVLFSKLKFRANTKNFHAPANSMINVVMQTKKGNPLSLSVIYMLIAQKLDLPVYGVNLPNMFILTYKTKEQQFYINTFNRGLIFSREDIDSYITQINLAPRPIYYEPCSHTDIIIRTLHNLSIAFEKLDDHSKSDEIKELLALLE